MAVSAWERRVCPYGLPAILHVLTLAGLGLAVAPPVPVSAQAIHRGLFADRDSATREVLAFLGGLGAHGPSATSCSPSTPTRCCWRVPVGLVCRRRHAAAGIVDTAREGSFGFGAWAIVCIVTVVAVLASLLGRLKHAQHAVVGPAHVGGDSAKAVRKPFSQDGLAERRPIVPRPDEAPRSRTL